MCSLPGELLAFIQRQATLKDHTLSGAIRHLIAEAARLEVPPSKPFGVVLPNVSGNAASIAAARALIAELQKEQVLIERRRRKMNGSAIDDKRDPEIAGLISVLEDRITLAERMMEPIMDNDAISTMTPEQATAALAAMGTAAAPSPPAPTGAATPDHPAGDGSRMRVSNLID